jgi:DNA-binding phage protein
MDRDIQKAIEDGQRNQEAKQLIHNWCRHARVEKFGGTGIIEMQTGLPIGHHAMVCDFAPASGMATYHLEEAALYFHDAYCKTCEKRQPVALPNISTLIARRDRARELAQVAHEASMQRDANARSLRSQTRANLRSHLSIPASTFLDDLQSYDDAPSAEGRTRLIESARLAPELLETQLVEHMFALLEGDQPWFITTGLIILSEHAIEPARVVKIALRCLANLHFTDLSATIAAGLAESIESADVADAIPGLALVATPPDPEYPLDSRPEGNAEPLLSIAARFPNETATGLLKLLDSPSPSRVAVAAKSIGLLISTKVTPVARFIRPLVVQLSRAEHLLDFDRDQDVQELSSVLTVTIATAFLSATELTDSELQAEFRTASAEGEGRISAVYNHVVRRIPFDLEKSKKALDAPEPFRTALVRLAALAESSENQNVIQSVLESLRHPHDLLVPLASEMMDLFLGTAAIIDSKLQSPEPDSTILKPRNFLESLEQNNRRSRLSQIRDSFIELAVMGARSGNRGLDHFESLLARRDVLPPSFEAALIRQLSPLLNTGVGLKVVLPYLYRAMVGPSQLVRAAAASTIEDIGTRRLKELPSLVLEAFLTMLNDSFVIVHQTAVRALRRISFPKGYDRFIANSVDGWIATYRQSDDKDFLITCIDVRSRLGREEPSFPRIEGKVFVAILATISPALLLSNRRNSLLRNLRGVEGYSGLVISLLEHCRMEHEMEGTLELLQDLPDITDDAQIESLIAMATRIPHDTKVCGTFVEVLSRNGHSDKAMEVAKIHENAFGPTTRERARKLHATQLRLHAEFETLLSQGRIQEALLLGDTWRSADKEIQEIHERTDQANPFRSLLGPPPDH